MRPTLTVVMPPLAMTSVMTSTAAAGVSLRGRRGEAAPHKDQAGGGWSTWTGVNSVKSGFVAASEVAGGDGVAGQMLWPGGPSGQPLRAVVDRRAKTGANVPTRDLRLAPRSPGCARLAPPHPRTRTSTPSNSHRQSHIDRRTRHRKIEDR